MPVLEAAIANRIEREIVPALKSVYAPPNWGLSGEAAPDPASVDYIFLDRNRAITSAGRYHDRLVRQSDRWRFAERRIVFLGEAP